MKRGLKIVFFVAVLMFGVYEIMNVKGDDPFVDTFLETSGEDCIPYDVPVRGTGQEANARLTTACDIAKTEAVQDCKDKARNTVCVTPCKKESGDCSEASIIRQTKVRAGSTLANQGFTVGHWYCAAESKATVKCKKK
ncbi:MAG: hypothetical protein AABX72_01090 [Nanoarchaeota archaeon]